jgi:Cys-tRNA(Pro)/Cys-tRNA(Cys) deacylase
MSTIVLRAIKGWISVQQGHGIAAVKLLRGDRDSMPVNNVTRFLDSRKVRYQAFETPAEKLGATETARILNVDPEVVFKTIVITRDKPRKPILAVVPGPWNVDLKLLAVAVAEKKVYLPTEREAEKLTGLQAGGISPLALINKGFQVVLDSSAQKHMEIHISGGQRGMNIKLPVEDLIKLTNARLASICHESNSPANSPLTNTE